VQIDRLASSRHGVITSRDARTAGLTAAQVKYRVARGIWRRLHAGVFAIAGAPPTWEQRVTAAVLAAGRGALASHTTAARLWELAPMDPQPIVEVTVPRPRLPRLEGTRVHRSLQLSEADRSRVGSIPVTSIPRTLVDLTAVCGLGWIARAMDDVLRRNRTTISHIRECSDRLNGAPGRRPTVVRLLVAERLGPAVLTESGLERVVLGVLLDGGAAAPVPQHPVTIDGRRYRLDFAWPDQRVALEVDGFGPHSGYAAFHDDRRRDLALQGAGWRVLHVTDEMAAPTILAAVSAALAR
jgi:Transcriptional regulator, AbiEi antitoxin